MAAYGALLSLMNLIHDIQNHHSPPISLNEQQVESLTEKATFLLGFLESYASPFADVDDEADPLEIRIADAAYAAEDVIESYIADLIKQSRSTRGEETKSTSAQENDDSSEEVKCREELSFINLYEDLHHVLEEMDLINKEAAKIDAEKVSTSSAASFLSSSSASSSSTSLKKLSLWMDREIEWEKMMLERIGSLPFLQKLTLGSGCFKTGKWEIGEDQFPCLKYLSLYECDGLKQWTTAQESSSIFPRLEYLHISGMKRLKEIPREIGEIPTLREIKLFRCSESVVRSAKEIVEEQMELQGELPFHVKVLVNSEEYAAQQMAGPNFEILYN